MASTNRIYLTAGDTLPTLEGVLTDDAGTAVDITDYTITCHIGYETPLVRTATITDAAAGEFEVRWQAGDLVAGTWDVEIQYVSSAGTVTSSREAKADGSPGKKIQLVIDEEIA